MTRYEQGFMRKCAEYGLDITSISALLKRAVYPDPLVSSGLTPSELEFERAFARWRDAHPGMTDPMVDWKELFRKTYKGGQGARPSVPAPPVRPVQPTVYVPKGDLSAAPSAVAGVAGNPFAARGPAVSTGAMFGQARPKVPAKTFGTRMASPAARATATRLGRTPRIAASAVGKSSLLRRLASLLPLILLRR